MRKNSELKYLIFVFSSNHPLIRGYVEWEWEVNSETAKFESVENYWVKGTVVLRLLGIHVYVKSNSTMLPQRSMFSK